MKKFVISFIFIVQLFSLTLIYPHATYAANGEPAIDSCIKKDNILISPAFKEKYPLGTKSLTFTLSGLEKNEYFEVFLREGSNDLLSRQTSDSDGKATFHISDPLAFETEKHRLLLKGPGLNNGECNLWNYSIEEGVTSCNISWFQAGYPKNYSCMENGKEVNISISNVTHQGVLLTNHPVRIKLNKEGGGGLEKDKVNTDKFGAASVNLTPDLNGDYEIRVYETINTNELICQTGGPQAPHDERFIIEVSSTPSEEKCGVVNENEILTGDVRICDNIPDNDAKLKCKECMGGKGDSPENKGGVWTGLGCFKFSPSELIKQILQLSVSLGGGIAFLLLLYGAFLMTTSAGNPEAADNAKQIITGAITGLLVIIFSVVILNIVGVQILQIPGL